MLSATVLVGLTGLTGCGGASDGGAASHGASSSAAVGPAPASTGASAPTTPPLRIVVTNDDGVHSSGIDAIATALSALPGVRVFVVAPATNESGTGSATTPGGASYHSARTASGVRATAVDGYPSDAVAVALEKLRLHPDLVVSGVNRGANVGSAVPISGTVGAARAAIAHGVPAVAASAAVPASGGSPDYTRAVEVVVAWVEQHRAALGAGTVTTKTLLNVNTPSCAPLPIRSVQAVPVAPGDVRQNPISRCRSAVRRPRTDVEALNNGYTSLSQVPAVLATPYPR